MKPRRVVKHRWSVLLLLPACAHRPITPASTELEPITYDAVVDSQSLDGVRLKLPWEVKNPTRGPVVVENAQWKMSVDGEPDQTGADQPGTRIEAGASGSGALLRSATLATTPEAFAARSELSAQSFRIEATFVVGGSGGETFAAEWSGEFCPPRRPAISVRPQAARYGNVIELTFPIVIENLNPFPVACDGLDYSIKLDGVEVSHDTVAKGRVLNPGTETQFDVSRQIGKEDLQDLAKRLVRRPAFPYQVDGTLRVGDLQLRQTLSGQIQFSE